MEFRNFPKANARLTDCLSSRQYQSVHWFHRTEHSKLITNTDYNSYQSNQSSKSITKSNWSLEFFQRPKQAHASLTDCLSSRKYQRVHCFHRTEHSKLITNTDYNSYQSNQSSKSISNSNWGLEFFQRPRQEHARLTDCLSSRKYQRVHRFHQTEHSKLITNTDYNSYQSNQSSKS